MSVTKVDFYILKTQSIDARLSFICKLIEKIYKNNHQLFVFCQDETQAVALDEKLWVFKPESFIPHRLQNIRSLAKLSVEKIQIGINPPEPLYQDILLNESLIFPSFFTQFTRIIEVIHDDEIVKSQGRERYRSYQTHGCTIRSHKIH